jgi:ubiquinone/menaquinone biosynthesis C-methylase UbiE
MAATDKVFAGSIPEIYERLLVPLIFESYAADLAERLAGTDPQRVLETAAGTGVLTRAIASRIPARARLVATDLNQPMLDHARARQSLDGRIEWRQADALALPFEDQSFDVVACQFGAMFFPDKIRGYQEARRVSSRAVISSSTSGTASRRTSLQMSLPKRWQRCFRMILRDSWPAPHTAIMMSSKSVGS